MATIKIDELDEMILVSDLEAANVKGGAEETKEVKSGPRMLMSVQLMF